MTRASMVKADDDYRRESDHRTLTEAATIQSDRLRMAGVKRHHRKVSKQHSLVGRTLMAKGR